MNDIIDRKCYWCGDIESGFYHLECAKKMQDGNLKMYRKIVGQYQERIRLYEEVLHRNIKQANDAVIEERGHVCICKIACDGIHQRSSKALLDKDGIEIKEG